MKYAGCAESGRSNYPLVHAWFQANNVVGHYRDISTGGRIYRVADDQLAKLQLDPDQPGVWIVPVNLCPETPQLCFVSHSDHGLRAMDPIQLPIENWSWTLV